MKKTNKIIALALVVAGSLSIPAMTKAATFTDYTIGNYTYVTNSSDYGRWRKVGNYWTFVKPSGNLATGWAKIDNKWYLFDTQGYMQTGWKYTGGNWYYLKASGEMTTGWLKTDSNWYYLRPDGRMATGWIHDGNDWYLLQPNGAMATGWATVGGQQYFLKANGAMATGWIKVGLYWFYCYPDGHKLSPAKNGEIFNIDGAYHMFNRGGNWVKRVASEYSVTSSSSLRSPIITAHDFTMRKGQGFDTDRFDAEAIDCSGNDISEQIRYLGSVDVNMAGVYQIILEVTDKNGLTSQKNCYVTVKA